MTETAIRPLKMEMPIMADKKMAVFLRAVASIIDLASEEPVNWLEDSPDNPKMIRKNLEWELATEMVTRLLVSQPDHFGNYLGGLMAVKLGEYQRWE